MASSYLANLPKLRRTLTDVMEDELYHIPLSNSPSPSLQHARLNYSQELLNIPESFAEAHKGIMNSTALIQDDDDDNNMLMEDNDDEEMMLDNEQLQQGSFDDTDKLYTPEMKTFNPFHDYANPNVFNSYNNHLHQQSSVHQDPFQNVFEAPMTVSPRDAHIKLPEELMSADSNNPLFNPNYDTSSQLFVWPNDTLSKNQFVGPEQLYLDEISDDEEDDDLMDADMNNYYDVNEPTYSPPTSSHLDHLQNRHDLLKEKDMINQAQAPTQQQQQALITSQHPQEAQQVSDVPVSGPLNGSGDVHQNVTVKNENHDNDDDEITSFDIEEDTTRSGRGSSVGVNPSMKRKQSTTLASSLASSAGPDGLHQCQLINPSTHKACLKQFSRPYDLVRHQETIHASKKKIYRCTFCEDDFKESGNARLSNKTFSRGDALSRHIRVKHGLTGNEANEAIRIAKENVEYVDVTA